MIVRARNERLMVVKAAETPAARSAPDVPDSQPLAPPAAPLTPPAPAARDAEDAARAAPAAAKRRSVKKPLIGAALLAALAFGAWEARDYWLVGRFMVTTDNAYVGAESAAIAPKLAAYVADVAVSANQSVKTGDLLVRLDSTDYQSALDQAEARLATQRATIDRFASQAAAADASVLQAQAQIAAATAETIRTQHAYDRAATLARSDFASKALLDGATADRDKAVAASAAAGAGLASAKAARGLADAQKIEAQRGAAEIQVSIDKARRDLAMTAIVAPFDGVVAAKNVQVGDYATPGKRLLTLTPLDKVFIDANFKETQLRKIVPGEKVRIEVDAYPGKAFEGTVVGLAPGTGSVFSLLPTDNATGNFTKIVQRLAVRIAVDQMQDQHKLRPGMSVVASIDTRTAPAAAAPGAVATAASER